MLLILILTNLINLLLCRFELQHFIKWILNNAR